MPDLAKEAEYPPILDFHAHIFPEPIASKAVAAIGEFYHLPMTGGIGTLADLMVESRKAGIRQSVIFTTATQVRQVASIHLFMKQCQESEPSVLAFGTLHPDMGEPDVREELARIEDYQLHGVKLHPDFQGVAADSPFVIAATRLMAGRLPLLIHAGDYRQQYSQPHQIRRLALACPESTIIAAHLGGWSQWDEAATQLSGLPNVYVDTSSSLLFLAPADAVRQIRYFDPSHVLFGTDYPMWNPSDELVRFSLLELSEQEKAAILWQNGRALLGMADADGSR
jgi:uncharacterized protein